MIRRRAVLAVLLALAAGCDTAWEDGPRPERPKRYPLGQELSTVPGVSIRRVHESTQVQRLKTDGGQLDARGVGILAALAAACPKRQPLIDEDAIPSGLYDIDVKPDPGSADVWRLLVEACQQAFNLRIAPETREVDVSLLARVAESPDLKPSGPAQEKGLYTVDGKLRFEHYTMDDLAVFTGEQLERTVLNETGIPGPKTFDVDAEPHNVAAALPRAIQALGLELKRAKRKLEVIVIRKAPADAS